MIEKVFNIGSSVTSSSSDAQRASNSQEEEKVQNSVGNQSQDSESTNITQSQGFFGDENDESQIEEMMMQEVKQTEADYDEDRDEEEDEEDEEEEDIIGTLNPQTLA